MKGAFDAVEYELARKLRNVLPDFGLFAAPVARDKDPITSHAAAEANQPRRGTQASVILSMYLTGPLTDEEAATEAGIVGGWKRCSDLRRMELIAPTGETRKTSSGVMARTCALTPKGRALLDSFEEERNGGR
jgi:hypothetical protein